ncbi:MAG TPA: NAD(P)-dependent oxidoreductase, partial [Syntrophales bacterium]|nr:NAD(P)-dependent oxidoreductase [Syntrophales bacterium]HPQ44106.1 NAD(P)-dependent oxidoreductase [Syntrophales bacterium]
MLHHEKWKVYNPQGNRRVIVTKELPGERWIEILMQADCRVEVCTSTEILGIDEIRSAIGDRCSGAIGQLTEAWGDELFSVLKKAGGIAYSNYAVGYNNLDIGAATRHGISVGNTPGVLTETTAEMTVALTFAAARRVVEADRFTREGRYHGWLPNLFLGELLNRKTVGVIGAGRIGAAYARMMVEGHKMDLVYYDLYRNNNLEEDIAAYADFLRSRGEQPVTCRKMESIEGLLQTADLVSLHPILDETTHHLIDAGRLELMKKNAILINASRGPLIDEEALVNHCRNNPDFRAGLDVFEDEPDLKPGLVELDNVVIVPHLGSATIWTRQSMAILAAGNVAGILRRYPAWKGDSVSPFLEDDPPEAAPSILNAEEMGIPKYSG